MANKWIDFVRAYAKKNNITFGCALGDKNMLEQYRKQKVKSVPKKKKLVVVGDIDKQKRETEMMGMEDVNIPDEKIVIKRKKPKAKKPAEKPAEKPKTSAAQYTLQSKYLTREIKSFIDFRFNEKDRKEVVEDIRSGLQFWLDALASYETFENLKYKNKRQEKAILRNIEDEVAFSGYLMRYLAVERLEFLIKKNKLKPLNDDEYYDTDVDNMDLERIGLYYDVDSGDYKTDGDSLDDVKAVLTYLKNNFMEVMEKMDITPTDAITILNKRIEKTLKERGKAIWRFRMPKAKK
jgi:hypothetical protein